MPPALNQGAPSVKPHVLSRSRNLSALHPKKPSPCAGSTKCHKTPEPRITSAIEVLSSATKDHDTANATDT